MPESVTDDDLRALAAIRDRAERDVPVWDDDAFADRRALLALLDRLAAPLDVERLAPAQEEGASRPRDAMCALRGPHWHGYLEFENGYHTGKVRGVVRGWAGRPTPEKAAAEHPGADPLRAYILTLVDRGLMTENVAMDLRRLADEDVELAIAQRGLTLNWWTLADVAHARNESTADVGGHCNHDESPPECIREAQAAVKEYAALVNEPCAALAKTEGGTK